MSAGTLILICGLPGAGKSTLAKKLAVERGANRLCPDDWILSILKDPKEVPERNRLRDPVEQLLWREAQALLKLGVTVILENGFWAREEREGYLAVGRSLGAKVELHFVDAPFDVLWARVQKRNMNPLEFSLTKAEMDAAFIVFQPPSNAEGQTYDYFKHYQ